MDDMKLMKHGASMKEYLNEVARDRSSLSLTLRRTKRPSISAVRPLFSGPGSKQKSPSLELEICAFFQPDGAISYVNTNDVRRLSEMALGIESCVNTNQRMLDNLIGSEAFAIELVNALTSDEMHEDCKLSIIQIISSMFAAANIISEYYIDNGLSFSLMNLLQSESHDIVLASVALIRHLSGTAYAKDSFLCLGMHDILIEMSSLSQDENFVEECCTAICAIFQDVDEVDSTVMQDVIGKLVPLMQLPFANSVRAIITSLVYITNQQPVLVMQIFQHNLHPLILSLLSNETTCGSSLILLANMCSTHTTYVEQLLSIGILDAIQALFNTPHAAGAFAVLSGLIESLPSVVLPFAAGIIGNSIETTFSCGFEAKKEITYFISTYILYASTDDLQPLITEEVLDLIVDMLGCSVPIVIRRCLDAIQRCSVSIESGVVDISESTFGDLIQVLETLAISSTTTNRQLASHILERFSSRGE